MLSLSALLVFVLFVSAASLGSQSSVSSDEQTLRQIEMDTARFEVQNDATGFGKVLADDGVAIRPAPLSKKEFVQNVRSNGELTKAESWLSSRTSSSTDKMPDTSKGFAEDDTDVFTRDSAGWHLGFMKIARRNPVRVELTVAGTFRWLSFRPLNCRL